MTSGGGRREDIYLDDVDRQDFLKALAETCHKTVWQVQGYCLMRNHSKSQHRRAVAKGDYPVHQRRRARSFGHLQKANATLHRFMSRWVNRDPIMETGGINLYTFLLNSALKSIDAIGLTAAGITACDGNGNWTNFYPSNQDETDQKCAEIHEKKHLEDFKKRWPDGCKNVKKGESPLFTSPEDKQALCDSECEAHKGQRDCMSDQCKSGKRKQISPIEEYDLELKIRTYCDSDCKNKIQPMFVPPGYLEKP